MRTRWRTTSLGLVPLGVLAGALACHDETVAPSVMAPPAKPLLSVADLYDGGQIHGAIFTTTPNGGVVNANVQYTDKREVYLDGGPKGNAPITAAGLPNGLYVFQITDPPGKVLLSDDPAKCRVVRVDGSVIKELVKPSDLPATYGTLSNYYGNGNPGTACHIPDSPDGVAGASGHHDTNVDVDHGAEGAIVVQMMPFLDTPNPGGVYKAWITPLQVYVGKGGKLDQQTAATKVQGKVVGYARDPGFAAPLSKVKTDNFKVKENPPFVRIDKLIDANRDGVSTGDAPYAVPPGWPVTVTEQTDAGPVTNEYFAPTGNIGLPLNTTVTVCERVLAGYLFSYAYVDGQKVTPQPSPTTDSDGNPIVCVDVTSGAGSTVAVILGNRPIIPNAKISISPLTATNAVNTPHTLTGTVLIDHDGGAGWENAPDGTTITFTKSSGPGAVAPASCTTVGGSCTTTLTSSVAGLSIVAASSTLTVDGTVFNLTTNGAGLNSGPAQKTWVDARISITPPTATNGIYEPHALTGTVTINRGVPDAWVSAPSGTTISFNILSGPGALTPTSCTTVGTTGACGVTLNSSVTGTTKVAATSTLTVSGQAMTRTTDGTAGNSGPAVKNWVDGSLQWQKIDGATPPRLLLGATFQVHRTHDRFGTAVSAPDFSVTDNNAPDEALGAAGAGKFKVSGLPLGRYCVKETSPPPGYLLASPAEQCGIELTLAVPNGSANPFVNSLQGRMTGGSGTIEVTLPNGDVVSLTSGFTIHCDIVLSNNIEVNWPGNKWHITKPITSALCVDDPNVVPDQPDAPFDTFIGTADGELNGIGVSKIRFVFVDGDGSPGGKANDRASMTIWDAQGKVVLSFTNLPIKGNLQAHEDQPHKP